jgi:hypothetical protein
MPPAKKSARRAPPASSTSRPSSARSSRRTAPARSASSSTPARSSTRSGQSRTTATRREVERRIARFEKHLDDASEALQLLGKDIGRGGQDAYKEVTKALQALRRDAQKTNRNLLKDFDKLRDAVTPSRSTRRSSTASRTRSNGAGGTARSSRVAGTTSSRSPRHRPSRLRGRAQQSNPYPASPIVISRPADAAGRGNYQCRRDLSDALDATDAWHHDGAEGRQTPSTPA